MSAIGIKRCIAETIPQDPLEVLRKLTPEEAALVEPLSDEAIEAALEKGYQATREIRWPSNPDLTTRFRSV